MLDRCPRCGCKSDVPWVWKLLFKIKNPFGLKKLSQVPIDIDFDVNATVNKIVTDEVVADALEADNFAMLRPFLTGTVARKFLDSVLPDKITKNMAVFHCWNCGWGQITSDIE